MTFNSSTQDPGPPREQEGFSLEGILRMSLLALAVLLLGIACYLIVNRGRSGGGAPGSPPAAGAPSAPSGADSPRVEVGIAYGTEKKRWLEAAVREFEQTPQAAGIRVNLIPMGSLEGAQAILRGDEQARRINVWSPASSLYQQSFALDWQVKYGNNPVARSEPLALTPMVFVFWDERYQPFVGKYQQVNFKTIGQALSEKSGWGAIAGQPDWGLFKFGHTHPNQSNSGLMTLVLMAYDYNQKSRDLSLKDIMTPAYQEWSESIERGVSGMDNSTGTMMREMVLKGPSSYDALFVYESVVIDYLKNAEGRWGRLRVVYPKYNAWNDNPYCILDTPWSSPQQRQAALVFLDFLLSEPVQREALQHGFRPGNPSVPVKFPESPFVQYASYGLQVDLTTVCEPPKPEVLNNLLASWQRSQGPR